jgi:hypothetical protein
MTRRIAWVAFGAVVLFGTAYGAYRWAPWTGRDRPAAVPGDLYAVIPDDLTPVAGTVTASSDDGLTIAVGRYVRDAAGTYFDEQPRSFRFNEHTNIFMLLRERPVPEDVPVTGDRFEELAEPQLSVGPEELLPGISATVLYSAADGDPVPVAWRVYFSQP